MLKIKLLVITAQVRHSSGAASYNCLFGPDADGEFVDRVVDSGVALNCDRFCQCQGMTNNKCLFGPDTNGNFIEEFNVTSELVDSCDRDWCICDTHEFEGEETYEYALAQKLQIGIDITARDED